MSEKSELKLFVVGEASGNTDEWTGPERSIVVARNADEAEELTDRRSKAFEVVPGVESQVVMFDVMVDNL